MSCSSEHYRRRFVEVDAHIAPSGTAALTRPYRRFRLNLLNGVPDFATSQFNDLSVKHDHRAGWRLSTDPDRLRRTRSPVTIFCYADDSLWELRIESYEAKVMRKSKVEFVPAKKIMNILEKKFCT